ncbi:30S ribosomal protein S4 [bacterium]|jgi:small subunit ribosomal protein S4|nr:30S ribosomal protein S4 [bacterium]MBT3730177.1 30S ribosomal protein S4 [bacterium]MBT4894613.1 30S ribosomal protein S4 [bacterium]
MKIGPKYKICKRLGSGVFDKCQTQKFALVEDKNKKKRGSSKRPRQMSEYGKQLIEKQKMRYTYGIAEKQLTKYVKEALARKDSKPATQLIENLESRLDNVVYRLGLANSRQMARQMVSHGHITIGGRKVTIPSYRMSAGLKIGVREGSRGSVLFTNLSEKLRDHKNPSWVSFDEKSLEGEVKGKPVVDNTELMFDVSSVFEFYSR